MESNTSNSKEEQYEVSWTEIFLFFTTLALLLIAYLLYSYGEYMECVKPFEVASNYFEYNDPKTVFETFAKTPSELASKCEFPKRP